MIGVLTLAINLSTLKLLQLGKELTKESLYIFKITHSRQTVGMHQQQRRLMRDLKKLKTCKLEIILL
jgi:hypothetical protein